MGTIDTGAVVVCAQLEGVLRAAQALLKQKARYKGSSFVHKMGGGHFNRAWTASELVLAKAVEEYETEVRILRERQKGCSPYG